MHQPKGPDAGHEWPDDPDFRAARECLEALIDAARRPPRIVELHEAMRNFGRCARRAGMSPRAALNFVRQLLDRRERAERREQTISDHALLALLSASYYEP